MKYELVVFSEFLHEQVHRSDQSMHHMRLWRNWKTREPQNLLSIDIVGSNPTNRIGGHSSVGRALEKKRFDESVTAILTHGA